MKCDSDVTDQATWDSNALIIFPLKCPDQVLTELIDIDSVSEAVDKSRQSDKPIFCDSLEWLEYKNEQLDNIAGCLRIEFVSRLDQDNLQETRQVVLVLSCFLLSEILKVWAQSIL